MHHHDKLDQLLVTKVLLDHFLEVKVLAIGCSKNVLVDPFENYFRVNLKTPNESGEHLDRPTVPKDVLHILHVHTELVTEALLDVEWDLTEDAVDGGDSLICHRNLGKIGILEEAIVWLL